jgi:hypothetical protein
MPNHRFIDYSQTNRTFFLLSNARPYLVLKARRCEKFLAQVAEGFPASFPVKFSEESFTKSLISFVWIYTSTMVIWLGMYEFRRKKTSKEEILKELSMLLQHTPFMYKYDIQMLMHTIHTVLIRECTDAALITVSIFFSFNLLYHSSDRTFAWMEIECLLHENMLPMVVFFTRTKNSTIQSRNSIFCELTVRCLFVYCKFSCWKRLHVYYSAEKLNVDSNV